MKKSHTLIAIDHSAVCEVYPLCKQKFHCYVHQSPPVDLISSQFSLYHNPTSWIHINLLIYSEGLKGVCSFAVLRPIKAVNIGVYKRVVYQAKNMIYCRKNELRDLVTFLILYWSMNIQYNILLPLLSLYRSGIVGLFQFITNFWDYEFYR